jgi:hypothetical protein
MTTPNEISDEILHRLHSIQFKSEKLVESLSNSSNHTFNISNDETLQLVSFKRQYMNEINESFSNKM